MQISLNDKKILVSGALGAIASVVNKRLLECGAYMVLTDVIEAEEAMETIRAWGTGSDRWVYHKMDVLDEQAVTSVIGRVFEQESTDLFIGLAGGCPLHPFNATGLQTYRQIFDYNYFGQLYATAAMLKEWTAKSIKGHVIYTSSLVAGLPMQDLSAYIPAKAAVESLSKCLALEYAGQGIRFNCIAPGHVSAGSSQKVYETDIDYKNQTDRIIPLKRLVDPLSVANMFAYLCSDLAADINGQVIKIDCGASIPKVG